MGTSLLVVILCVVSLTNRRSRFFKKVTPWNWLMIVVKVSCYFTRPFERRKQERQTAITEAVGGTVRYNPKSTIGSRQTTIVDVLIKLVRVL
ncbi:hypothetical protein BC943DRAFT_32635 [Umbelopsis sp. AD052]|nr:hypothetical protein BC943DRAFT_32635 [Umbelopsis sp. AD052]